MTVYVDGANIPATVGRIKARWSHLTADTKDELHEFAVRLGLQRRWFQTCKRSKSCKPPERCIHWHYDVVATKRDRAIELGAVEIDRYQMVEILKGRRERMAAAARPGPAPAPLIPAGTMCAHDCGRPATKLFLLLLAGEDRPVCDEHWQAETDHKREAIERHIKFLRSYSAARQAERGADPQ